MKDFFKIGIVASRYHSAITEKLVDGALATLKKYEKEVGTFQIDTFWVAGAFELPQGAAILAATKKYDAVIPLGCLIEGETKHFDFISQAVANGLDQIGRSTQIPVAFGVITAGTLEQAQERAGGRWGNKGEEAVNAAL